MTRTILALSPHLDDAAFSCGGTLAQLARRGARVVIATLFTASMPDPRGFALACQTDKGIPPGVDYMALRRAEDAVAASSLGAEPIWLPFPEAPHRGYGSAAELFGPVRDDDRIAPELGRAVAELVRRVSADLVLAPQAVGGHVDHVLLVRALHAVKPAQPLAWWRDFPYGAKGDAPEPFRDVMAGLPARTVLFDDTSRAAKRLACHAYESQLGFQFGGPAGLDAKLAEAAETETFRGAPLPALNEGAPA